ncbi:MAG: hypothetical protein U0836_17985 [Pirellulales bacterium]
MKEKTARKPGRPRHEGIIDPTLLYRIDEFQRRVGWDEWATRAARKKGLKTIRAGRVVWVRGRDFFEYIDRLAAGEGAPD